jgi:archaemetzincin
LANRWQPQNTLNKNVILKNTLFALLLLLSFACGQKNKESVKTNISFVQPIVYLQPLGYFDDSLLSQLQTGIKLVFPVQAFIATDKKLPANAWYAPRHRYWADSILVYLQPMHQKNNEYILGVTEADISTKNGTQPNWGVMGLGLQPGHCCVVSTYRLYKYPQTQKQLLNKLLKVSLHELGHNFGLQHCANTHCIMTDAKGKDNLANENDFCAQCRKTLASKGFEPQRINFF